MKPIYLLAILPFVGFLAGGFLLEARQSSLIFGLPFLLVWNLGWMVACSACLALIYRCDKRDEESRQ